MTTVLAKRVSQVIFLNACCINILPSPSFLECTASCVVELNLFTGEDSSGGTSVLTPVFTFFDLAERHGPPF